MRHDEAIRWTKEKAATEFGINPRTLAGRLATQGIRPAADQRFSTSDICKAVFGDIDGERLRLIREQADKASLENAKTRGDLVSASDMRKVVERGLAAMIEAVKAASNLEHEDKAKILNHIKRCGESVVSGVANGDNAAELHSEPVG